MNPLKNNILRPLRHLLCFSQLLRNIPVLSKLKQGDLYFQSICDPLLGLLSKSPLRGKF